MITFIIKKGKLNVKKYFVYIDDKIVVIYK